MKVADIEKIIKLVAESNVVEVEVQFSNIQRIRVSKIAGQVTAMVPATYSQQTPITQAPVPASSDVEAPASQELPGGKKPIRPANHVAIKSPMIGTFYLAPAPDAPPYVEVGDTVKPGTVVCIVEAMKLMNEIESDITGKVVEILVQNETPVEFGQELFLIEPS